MTMTDIHDTPGEASPLRKAFRESRGIVLVSVAIALSYNIFAATRIPWIRESRPKADTTSATTLPSDTSAATHGADTIAAALPAGGRADTAAVPAAIDTAGMAALSKHERDSIAQARRDSLRTAQQDARRVRDSIAQADGASFLDQVAGMKEIKTDIAKRLFDMKAAIFIDARPEDHYMEGHIAGAQNIYESEWQSHIPELVKIPRDQLIVTYCGGGDECELSHDLAKDLQSIGFKKVVVYTGGIKDWTAKKYPVQSAQK
jgi:rhodanese-related sulfurtransferase